ncbi:uncharacterized protein TRIVIDRAFT_54134 [Trichoderma virens Gv29-8]|uniref:Cytochrome b mRNA-processing protein 4 n=1 Tax=Hypocrea virens (strain Gv29-8 / FGSC 10586) TaxID=413071 RepID=G9MQS7_HYPVG|nr:uncharacterized protein TRIVIDRAFT_54134 [Trichoderma virens Gv29-8]EHK22456.1 hypothetical protein TRIVIDRAFT_54134 [Trichoderma virens Gv29-8]UKZ47497.1 assembly factor cbp4 [Trichoderma virens]UKZ74062.1 assembly factor cbp4 [Trichoderma virens FT-333]
MPPKKAFNWGLWIKVLVGGTIISVGGPALTFWLVPTEEELRSRYNPELLKRSLEGREERQQEFDQFVTRLKEYSKSDKPIWAVIKEEEERKKKADLEAARLQKQEAAARRDEMRREAGLGK